MSLLTFDLEPIAPRLGLKVEAGNRTTTTTLVQRDMGYATLHEASSRKYIKNRVIAPGVG